MFLEKIDPKKAAAVWQRVHNSTPPSPSVPPSPSAPPLPAMIHDELVNGTAYRHLSRQLSGASAGMLQQLSRQAFSRAACLKGMYRMLSGTPATVALPTYTPQDPHTTLRRCYGREMQCLARYEAHSADPEYGRVFAQLAAQGQSHCGQLLEILGNLKHTN